MLITCPFTGTKVTRPLFVKDSFFQPHAIFSATGRELSAALSNKENSSITEKYLIFMACVVKTGLVQFSAPLPEKKLSEVFIVRYLPEIFAIQNWLCARPTLRNYLPRLVITKDTAQETVKEFIDILLSAKAEGITLQKVDSFDELAVDIEERRQFRRAIASAKSTRKEYFNLTIAWAINNLTHTREVQHSTVETVHKILTDKSFASRYPLSMIKSVRGICIEYLPEEKHDDYLRKLEIKSALDSIIVDRLAILASLGTQEELTKAKEEIENVRQSYTITLADGREFQNSAAPVVQKIAGISLSESLGAEENTEHLKGTARPVQSQFKSFMAYSIALAKWKKENEQ